jgi:hypothetical protein
LIDVGTTTLQIRSDLRDDRRDLSSARGVQVRVIHGRERQGSAHVKARRRRESVAALVPLLAVAAVAALGGCGGDGPPGKPQQLSAGEQSAVREAQMEIRSYCRELALYLARRRGPPSQAETGRAYGAVDRLAEIARAKPSATQPLSGRTVRELLGDVAEDLEGSNCAPNVVQRINQVLATLPAQ